jgi:broad specificity phosphatase PhoE
MTEGEIAAAFPDFWRDYKAGRVDTFPAGEPRAAFIARVHSAVHELAAADWRGDLLLVAHRGTVRQALRALLGVAPGAPDEFGVALASVSVLADDDPRGGTWRLEALGLLP